MTTTQILAENLYQLRRHRQMTQGAVARSLGVSVQAVSKWEQRICCPDITLLPEIAGLFGITIDELFRAPAHAEQHTRARALREAV